MSTYRESFCAKRLDLLKAEINPPAKAEPVKTDAELLAEAEAEAASWEIEPSPELIASVAEREARIKGEI